MAESAGVEPRTILLVDDDLNVRSLLTRVLERAGHRVLGAAGGSEALAVLADFACPVHLLITDVIMPGLSGHELIKMARKLRPAVEVICLSARIKDAVVTEGIHYMPKPFTLSGLVATICALLARST